MITFEEAYNRVMEHTFSFGDEKVELLTGTNRILAENIFADRDFPPFDRSTKDGIAINFDGLRGGNNTFPVAGIIAAGMPEFILEDTGKCYEIMTGAVIPRNTDTVVMYEDTEISEGIAKLHSDPHRGQNIHRKGSDMKQGDRILVANRRITGAEVGILAAVGKAEVLVHRVPRITTVSTGNELVAIKSTPEPHQIRRSNTISLRSLLREESIQAESVHLKDDIKEIHEVLNKLLEQNDVIMLSGGVSRGKFDFIPEALEELGVRKVFHRVRQRPGKPFWFGMDDKRKTAVFSFPGNPVSTFANYHIYFRDWLYKCWGLPILGDESAVLGEEIDVHPSLTLFNGVKIRNEDGILKAFPVKGNGSGDLISLGKIDGLIRLSPASGRMLTAGDTVPFIPTRKLC